MKCSFCHEDNGNVLMVPLSNEVEKPMCTSCIKTAIRCLGEMEKARKYEKILNDILVYIEHLPRDQWPFVLYESIRSELEGVRR